MTKTRRSALTLFAVVALVFALAPTASAQARPSPATRSGFVTTPDGLRIHYLEVGRGSTILFVPGWTMPAWIWEQQIKHFSKTHRVVAMDPRSQGQSSRPTEGHYPAARARDIKAVVDQLRLAPVLLVGWSMGVTELAAYVDQFGTDSVAGLVLVDGYAGADFDPNLTPKMWQWAAGFQKDRRKQTEAFVRSMYKKPQSEEYLKRVTEASLRTPTNSAIALFVGMFTSDYRPALAKIDKPALLVVAQSLRVALYQDMQKRIPGSQIEIFEGVGHALFVDEPERFNSLLDEFLKSLSGSCKSPH